MAIKITDECINCGACEPECPNNAIYDAGTAWRFSDGTNLEGIIDFGINKLRLTLHKRQFLMKFIISYRINVPNVKDFMMNLNVLLFAR